MNPNEFFSYCEEKFQEVKERLNIKDKESTGLNYMAQITTERDDKTPKYWFQLTNVGHLMRPLTWVGSSFEEVKEKMDSFIDDLDFDAVEISYLKIMAEHAEKVAEDYRKRAEDNIHRVAIEGKTKLKDVRKGKKG